MTFDLFSAALDVLFFFSLLRFLSTPRHFNSSIPLNTPDTIREIRALRPKLLIPTLQPFPPNLDPISSHLGAGTSSCPSLPFTTFNPSTFSSCCFWRHSATSFLYTLHLHLHFDYHFASIARAMSVFLCESPGVGILLSTVAFPSSATLAIGRLHLLYRWQIDLTGEYRDCMFVHDTYPTLLILGTLCLYGYRSWGP